MTMRIGGILAAAVLIAAALPARAQETYPTPEAAVKDLVDSAKAKTPGFGDRILGKDGAALLRSGDADAGRREPEGVQRGGGRVDRDRRRTQWREDLARRARTAGPCRCRSSRPTRAGASTSPKERRK